MIYADHASTTPIRQEVIEAMQPYLSTAFGNPSSLYKIGNDNVKIINQSRRIIASSIGAEGKEVFFTSGGTEANNLAIKGTAFMQPLDKRHIISTPIEHHATINSLNFLKKLGFEVDYVNVDNQGFIDMDHLRALIRPSTFLVSVIWANNEIGTIQDLNAISLLCQKHDLLLHVDAIQCYGKIPIDVTKTPVDLLSLSSHKIYGPKGVGAIYIKKGTSIEPLLHGGNQEQGLRAGTQNVAGIIGFAKAAELMTAEIPTNNALLSHYSKLFMSNIHNFLGVRLNGPQIGTHRIPGHLNLSFSGITGKELAYLLDQKHIYVSTGSACDSGSIEPSHVLRNINVPKEFINGTIRITFGRLTTEENIKELADTIKETVTELR